MASIGGVSRGAISAHLEYDWACDEIHIHFIRDMFKGPQRYEFNSESGWGWVNIDMAVSTRDSINPGSISIKQDMAQSLFDAMAAKGFRPIESEKERQALENHLEDSIGIRDRLLVLVEGGIKND
jgi:hypothetical protein